MIKTGFILFMVFCASLQAREEDEFPPGAFTSAEANQNYINEYEKNPDGFEDRNLLPIAICYTLKKDFITAETIYRKFLRAKPNSAKGLRGLAVCLFQQKKDKESIEFYQKAWALGDLQSLKGLGAVFVANQNWSELEKLVPNLLENKHKDIELVNCLLGFCLATEQKNKDLFYKVIDGLSDEELIEREDTRAAVFELLQFYKDYGLLKILQAKVKQSA